MDKYLELVDEHLAARKAKDTVKSNVLGVLRGEVETALKGTSNDPSTEVEAAAKKMVKGLEIVGGDQSKIEIDLLTPYLPQTLTEDQIKSELANLNLQSLGNVGLKMKTAMGVIGGRADGALVKQVVFKYFN